MVNIIGIFSINPPSLTKPTLFFKESFPKIFFNKKSLVFGGEQQRKTRTRRIGIFVGSSCSNIAVVLIRQKYARFISELRVIAPGYVS